MRLQHVSLCGFRGYRAPIRIDFGTAFTILDGRNGVGKSTLFDAIEFALTGTISKYDDAKAAGESVSDYIWYTGKGLPPEDRYVEVGFTDGEFETTVRRTEFDSPATEELHALAARLVDPALAPNDPLEKLCARVIIRDEQIARLSLDLRETDRYSLVREGLGANDSEEWITRARAISSAVKARSDVAQSEVVRINQELAQATRRIDEVRGSLATEDVLSDAVQTLRSFSGSTAPMDELAGPARKRLAEINSEVTKLQALASAWDGAERERNSLLQLEEFAAKSEDDRRTAEEAFQSLSSSVIVEGGASALSQKARDLIALVTLGRDLDVQSDHCPLCASKISHEAFQAGLRQAEALADALNIDAAAAARRERELEAARKKLDAATEAKRIAVDRLRVARLVVAQFDQERTSVGEYGASKETLAKRIESLHSEIQSAERAVRVLDTLRLNAELQRVLADEASLRGRLAEAQKRAGVARRAEVNAKALYDATRRATAETLDRRLEQALPLMAELYGRLRPHPTWTQIQYSVRGDVRRFLKLQLEDDLNPQFMFSSGQRRATGLAFLLSVNLSLAWSKLRTVLLDDPVQHVDDFRTIHLAEVLGHLVANNTQVICAVEDAALADLLCRRMPIRGLESGKRYTLGPGRDGDLTIARQEVVPPLPSRTLVGHDIRAAG